MSANLDVKGLLPLVRELKGPLFRDVNRELRSEAYEIARALEPSVSLMVAMSPAPQAAKMAATVRAKRDRVPVLSIGAVTPKLSGFKRRRRVRVQKSDSSIHEGKGELVGSDPKRNRGSVAHGVLYGPLGGHRATPRNENYYRIPRDPTGGPVGRALAEGGHLWEQACKEYRAAFEHVLTRHGFIGPSHEWNGHG